MIVLRNKYFGPGKTGGLEGFAAIAAQFGGSKKASKFIPKSKPNPQWCWTNL